MHRLVLLYALLVPAVAAQPVLDPAFGDGGVSTFTADPEQTYSSLGVFAAGDRPVSYGSLRQDPSIRRSYAAVQFSESGVRDLSFGRDGLATARLGVAANFPKAAAVMDDGRLIIVGSYRPGGDGSGQYSHPMVARFLPDGSPDPSLDGGARGYDIGTGSTAGGVVARGDQSIISVSGYSGCRVMRLDEDGEKDRSFGVNGYATAPGGCFMSAPTLTGIADDLAVLSEKRIRGASTLFVTRFDQEGERVLTFGIEGAVATPFNGDASPTVFETLPDGGVFVAGAAEREGRRVQFGIRLAADGSPAPGWGETGRLWFDSDPDGGSARSTVAVALADGSLVFGMNIVRGGETDVLLYRLRTDGSLDPSFGPGGYASLADLLGAEVRLKANVAYGLALDASGRLLLTGLYFNEGGRRDAYVARILLRSFLATSTEPALGESQVLVSPNPLRERSHLTLSLDVASHVHLAVYDMLGRRAVTLHDGPAAAGELRATWDASGAAPGAYVVVARVGDGVTTRRVSVVR